MDSSWRASRKVSVSSDSEISEDESESSEPVGSDLYTDDEGSPDSRRRTHHSSRHKGRKCKLEVSSSSSSSSQIISEDEDISQTSKNHPHERSTSNLNSDKSGTERSFASISNRSLKESVVISSDEASHPIETKSKKVNSHHPANVTPERQNELRNAKKFLEMELMKENEALKNLMATTKKVELNTLPDRGAKLRKSIERQANKVKELNERLSYVSSNIVDPSASRSSPKHDIKIPNIVDLTKDYTDLTEMGKRALATHQAQQTQTVKTLEKLYTFLRTSNDFKEASEPTALKIPLLPHQKVALEWLVRRESASPPGGILADDMGLGKTLTIISLILKDMEINRPLSNEANEDESPIISRKKLVEGKTLVICPSSVIGQWAAEVSSKVRAGHLSVYTHHGAKRETRPQNLARYDVVITTYTIVQFDNKDVPGPLMGVRWKRVVLDEAHIIRNHKCKTAQAIFALQSRRRWALTGTPIHNKQEDFYSLLKFLKCKPFDDIVIWKKMVDNKAASGTERLHLLTKSLLLRRTKEEIQEAGGLKSLKPKQFSTISFELDPEEAVVYDKVSHFSVALLAQYIHERAEKEDLMRDGLNIKRAGPSNPFEDHPELGKLYNKMIMMKGGVKTHHILVLLLRLRQICCHPSLVTTFIDSEELKMDGVEDGSGNDVGLIDQMMNMSIAPNGDSDEMPKKLLTSDAPVFRKDRCSSKVREILKCISEITKKGSDKIIVVSQWTSVLYIIRSFLKMNSVSLDGTIPVKDRGAIINDFNNNQHGAKILLLSLSAGGTGLNLVGANHLLLVDAHWNPQLEAQACDRIYRVGQTKIVYIYKFIVTDTIEERIVKLQNEKLEIAKGVLTGSAGIQSSKLTLRDLKQLFDVKH